MSAILDTGTTQSFINHKQAEKLPATVKTMIPMTVAFPMGKTLVATLAIQLDILINGFIYM